LAPRAIADCELVIGDLYDWRLTIEIGDWRLRTVSHEQFRIDVNISINNLNQQSAISINSQSIRKIRSLQSAICSRRS
jgi:hypothetical protein